MTSSVAASIPGLEEIPSADGMPTVMVKREELESACLALRNAGFSVLIDAVPMDRFPREPRFEISYLLLNPGTDGKPARLRVKVQLPGEDPRCPTLSNVWRAADWAEREAYDFFGIQFDGHPDPRRILMPEDWEGFPLRKDYPVQIKDPVKTYAPLQITEEEFVANIEAARQHTRQE